MQVAARSLSAEPKVQRLLRAERVNRVALDVAQSRHGRKCASAEFLRPRATFSEFCSPLDYVSARIKFFQKYEKSVTHDRRNVQYRGPRRKYFRWGKRSSRATDERRHFAPPRQASASCDAVGEESPKGRRGCNTPKFGDVQPVLPEFHPHAGKDAAQHSRVKGREVCFTLIYILFMSGIFLRARHNCAGRTDALC